MIRIRITPDPRRVNWTVRVNGRAVVSCKTDFMAKEYAKAIIKALEIAGVAVQWEGV